MAREILLSKKTEQGLRLDPRTKLLLIFIISIFVMGGTGGEAMGLIRLVLCTVPAILLLTSKQCAKAVGYIAVFSAFYAVQIYVLPHLTGILISSFCLQQDSSAESFPVLRLLPMQ